MAASNKKVVYGFQIFEKAFVLYVLYEKSKKGGIKYSIIIYPNYNFFSWLTTRKAQ